MNEKVKEFLDAKKKPNTAQILVVVALIVVAISVILSIACLSGIAKIRASVDAIAQDVAAIKADNLELSSRISSLEVTVDNMTTDLKEEQATRYITITKQPTSVETVLGREDAMMFSVEVTTSSTGLTFTWQIQDASGSWRDIAFDGNSLNSEFGIRLYQDTGRGMSQIWAKDLTEAAFGSYRCVIADAAGTSVTTNTVTVTQRLGG